MERSPWDPEGIDLIVDSTGRIADPSVVSGFDLQTYYQHLIMARCLDRQLSQLGLPMWASSAGEEASGVSIGLASGSEDWLYPGYRDLSIAVARGMSLEDVLAQCLGWPGAEGQGRTAPGTVISFDLGIAPVSDHLGMSLALACGQARGQKLSRLGHATIVSFGEGLTSTGLFHESVAVAVSCNLPIVFVCKSQTWPNGATIEAGVFGDSVAERVNACGMWSKRVDGADAVGVYLAIARALERVRDDEGPAFVDVAVTRMQKGLPEERDPIKRLERFLAQSDQAVAGNFDPSLRERLESAFHEQFSEIIARGASSDS